MANVTDAKQILVLRLRHDFITLRMDDLYRWRFLREMIVKTLSPSCRQNSKYRL